MHHLGELLLRELEGRQRLAELRALERVGQRLLVARAGRADRAPEDAVARLVQAAQRALEPADLGEHRVAGQPQVVEGQLGRDRGPQRQLALDLGGGEARACPSGTTKPRIPSSVCAHTTATPASVPLVIHILPPLSTQSSPSRLARVRIDAGVAAGVGLGQPEAAEHLAGGHPRQPLLPVLLGAPAVDRVHRQRALHGHEAAQPRVDGLQLAAGDAVGRRGHPRAAVALEVHAEQPQRAEPRSEVVGQRARVVPVGDVRRQLGGGEGAHRVADVALLGAQQSVHGEEVMGVDGHAARVRPRREPHSPR